MFVTTKRASAWLDQCADEPNRPAPTNKSCGVQRRQIRYAVRPLETPAGRCLAIRLVTLADGEATPRFFVLFESAYERTPRPRWVPIDRVLSESDAVQWVKEGFRA